MYVRSFSLLTSIPLDASQNFSSKLKPYLWVLIKQMRGELLEGDEVKLAEALGRATITQGRKLTKQHEWLYDKVKKAHPSTLKLPVMEDMPLIPSSGTSPDVHPESVPKPLRTRHPKTKTLLFGSRMVAKPFIQMIWNHIEQQDPSLELLVTSNNIIEADALVSGHEAS